jgi:hypothetical protein
MSSIDQLIDGANAAKSTMLDDVVKACSEAEKLAIELAARIEALESEVKEQALQYISSFGQCKEHMERISALEKLAKEMAEALELAMKNAEDYGEAWARCYVADFDRVAVDSKELRFKMLSIKRDRLNKVPEALSRYREVCGCQ